MQLALIIVPLWWGVSAYNKHFSYDAHLQRQRAQNIDESLTDSGRVVPIDRQVAGDTVAVLDPMGELQFDGPTDQRSTDFKSTSSQPLSQAMSLLEAEDAQAVSDTDVESAEAIADADANGAVEVNAEDADESNSDSAPELLPADASIKVKTAPFAAIEEFPDSGPKEFLREDPVSVDSDKATELANVMEQLGGPLALQSNEPAPETLPAAIKGTDWLSAQDNSSYVIQLESSANQQVMRRKAQRLSVVNDLTIYPFVVSRAGEVIYGLSYGLYDTLDEARQASETLPDELIRYGSWIRQVGTLQRQARQIEQTR